MNPKKFRRAKAKRRRAYESILQKSAKENAKKAEYAKVLMNMANENASSSHEAKERLQSIVDDILNSRLAINIMANPEEMTKTFLADYNHPQQHYSAPRRAMYDMAVAFRSEVKPLPANPSIQEVEAFSVRVFKTLNELSRYRPNVDLEISSIVRIMADRLAHLILLRLTDNALSKVKHE